MPQPLPAPATSRFRLGSLVRVIPVRGMGPNRPPASSGLTRHPVRCHYPCPSTLARPRPTHLVGCISPLLASAGSLSVGTVQHPFLPSPVVTTLAVAPVARPHVARVVSACGMALAGPPDLFQLLPSSWSDFLRGSDQTRQPLSGGPATYEPRLWYSSGL